MNTERLRFVSQQIADCELELERLGATTIAQTVAMEALRRRVDVTADVVRKFLAGAPDILAPHAAVPSKGLAALSAAVRAELTRLAG